MPRIKKYWLWLLITALAVLPLLGLVSQFRLDFTTEGSPTLTITQPVMPEREFEAAAGDAQPSAPDGAMERGEPTERSPWSFAVHSTGEWAIRWLVLSLTCTPLYILFGWRSPLTVKKIMGLYAFLYSALHLLFFAADRGWLAVFSEVNFVLGLLAALIMIPLAVTSNQWAMQALGKLWKHMHRAAYAAAVLAVLHVVILGEGSWLVYAVLLAIGFALRVPAIRKSVTGFRRRWFRPAAIPA